MERRPRAQSALINEGQPMDQAYHLPPSSSGVVGWWPAFAVIWLCGCTASPVGPHHSGVDEDLADLCQEDPIQVQTTVDSWYARAGPQELLGAGNYVDVRWSWDPDRKSTRL